MKPDSKRNSIVLALAAVGVVLAAVVVLLLPKEDGASPTAAPAEQPAGPGELPKFEADLGQARPAEPIVVPTPAPETGADEAERARQAAAQRDESGLRSISGTVVREDDGKPLAHAIVVALRKAASDASAPAGNVGRTATTDAEGRFELRAHPQADILSVTGGDAWGRIQRYELQPGAETLEDLLVSFDTGFSIAGLVLDELGRPLAGGRVDVNGTVAQTSDESGRFLFHDVAPAAGVASVRVSARAPGHASGSGDALVPSTSGGTVNVELRLPPSGAIAGRVTDPRGAPLEGVQACVVYLMTRSHGGEAPSGLSATSDAQGDYLIDSVPEGRYVVEVGYGASLGRPGGEALQGSDVEAALPEVELSADDGHSVLSRGAQASKQLAISKGLALRRLPEIVVELGRTTRLDVQLFPPAALSGRVLDEAGAPVAQAHVTLESLEHWPAPDATGNSVTTSRGLVITSRSKPDGRGMTELAEVEDEARTDASGAFAFTGLRQGEKRLGVTAAGLMNQTRSLDLQPGEVQQNVDFTLERGLAVRGRVRDIAGAPIAGANVELMDAADDTASGGERVTDAEGRFDIGGLPPGPKRLIVFKSGFSSLWNTVEPGGAALELTMQPAPKVIGLVTHAASGAPITNFDVSIAYGGSTWANTGGSYPEGRFEMPIDSDVPCTVTVRSGGFREVVLKGVLPSRTAIDPLRIQLQPQ